MRLQNLDGRGLQLRTFGIDPSGRLLVVASIMSAADGTLPAGITVMRIGADGRLGFVRKYDVDVGRHPAVLERHGDTAVAAASTAESLSRYQGCAFLLRAAARPILDATLSTREKVIAPCHDHIPSGPHPPIGPQPPERSKASSPRSPPSRAPASSFAAPSASAIPASSIRSCCSTISATTGPTIIAPAFPGIRIAASRPSPMCWRAASSTATVSAIAAISKPATCNG